MDVGRLLEEGKRFLSKLPRSGLFLLLADRDTDGIISAHLFARYFHKRNPYSSILIYVVDREEISSVLAEHKEYVPVLLDLPPDNEVDSHAEERRRRIFVIDHHPQVSESPYVVQFNPHLYNIPRASRYNTGFLVYILFRDEVNRGGDLWKVAISSFGDTSYDYLRPYYYGFDRKTVELASHMVGSVPREKLGVLFTALEESATLDDFVGNEELLRMKEEFEKTLLDTLKHIESYCYYCSGEIRIFVLPPHLSRFKSAVATVYSKRNPEKLVCVGVEDEGVLSFSLRFQSAYERKIHLGTFASNLARRWGTHGGGHAPASGLRVPKDRLPEFVEEVKKLLS